MRQFLISPLRAACVGTVVTLMLSATPASAQDTAKAPSEAGAVVRSGDAKPGQHAANPASAPRGETAPPASKDSSAPPASKDSSAPPASKDSSAPPASKDSPAPPGSKDSPAPAASKDSSDAEPRPPVRAMAPRPPAPEATGDTPAQGGADRPRVPSDRDDDMLLESPSGGGKRFLQLQLGLRSMYVSDVGYDPFAEHDALVSMGAALSYPVWTSGSFSVAPFALWDYGSTASTARGKPTSLSVHRIEAGLEGRYHITWWLYTYARVAPGALSQSMSVTDEEGSTELKRTLWTFALDSAAGAAVLLGPRWAGAKFRLWAFGEGGYSWSDRQSVVLTPAARDDQAPVGDLPLGRLALRGPQFRLGVAVTY